MRAKLQYRMMLIGRSSNAPPYLRKSVLIGAAVLVLVVGFMAGNSHYSAAQTTTMDYDLDNDGLIEVRTELQFRAMHNDLDGDGSPTTLATANRTAPAWATAFPNAMTGAGCPARDHDDDSNTPDEPSCLGYELVDDITFTSAFETIGRTGGSEISSINAFTAKLVGNGHRALNPNPVGGSRHAALIGNVGKDGSIEGIGVVNPNFQADFGHAGGITSQLAGKVIGSYVLGGALQAGDAGGIAGDVLTGSDHAGLIAHSFVNGITTRVADPSNRRQGGLTSEFVAQSGTNTARCLNSYFSGDLNTHSSGATEKGLIADVVGTGTQLDNCYGDNTTDSNTANAWRGAQTADNTAHTRSKAQLTAPTGYTGPFANWDDYAADGTSLAAGAPRTDFWDFGDGTTFPMLKAWGHDYSFALERDQTGTDTVNLCTRTLAVANEIIRLLKDDTFADGVTGPVPADVMALSVCTAASDTQSVSVNNLRDYAATTAANPLNLNPNRTDPAAAKLTEIGMNDFAYLVNARHIDLSGNALTTVPARLFQGVRLGWLDLSNNELVTLPADLFAGLANIPSTARTGNAIHLNGNRLTDTGIPGRIFDTMIHINGLDLRDNALTRINTRWFEELGALGDKPASATAPVSYLGIGLGGNTVTEHYYANKLFSGVRYDIDAYTGASASEDLRTAIKAVITAAAGGTAPATLDLDSTDYYVKEGGNAGYQPSGSMCPTGLTFGPLGDAYFGDTGPECYVLPHWLPPSAETAQVAAPTGGALALEADGLIVRFSHPATATIIAYEIRYRELPNDPNAEWTQHWQTIIVTAGSGTKTATISGAAVTTGHQVQLRVVTTAGTSAPLPLTLAPDLDALANLDAVEESGTLVLSWDAPDSFSVDHYEYRTRRTGTTEWSDWTNVEHTGDLGSRQTHRLTNLGSGASLQVQLRFVVAGAESPVASVSGSTRVSVPDLESIKPVVRTLSVNAGDTVMLLVDVYNAQSKLANALAGSDDSPLVFRWSESGPGGGSFSDPTSGRRVSYTVPSLPGRYTVLAEAQPDGICLSHHAGESAITDADRAPCIATFTISVSRAPGQIGPQDPPVNPTGAIPSGMTDDSGVAYAVFTPVDGGTFTGTDITITAPAGAVPDRTLLGVSAAASAVAVPAPIPGASMSVAGSYYDINAITQDGSSPLARYTLDEPLTACLPYPDEFRAELSNVVAVERRFDGELSILTTKVRSNAGELTVCGAISSLPATVGVAKLGTVLAIPPTPTPTAPLPEAGATAPSVIVIALMLLAGALLLTGMRRISRMQRG